MKECCQVNPDFKLWLTGVEARMVDLLKPFRAFRYYAPGQNGSASMKAVLPALTGRSYDTWQSRRAAPPAWSSCEFISPMSKMPCANGFAVSWRNTAAKTPRG